MRVRQIVAMIVAAAMIATAPGHLWAGSNPRAEQELRQLEQDIAAATVRGDWHFVDRVLTPDWTCIDPYGRQLDKARVLAAIKGKESQINSLQVYDLQVRFVKDDLAVVTGRLTAKGSALGKIVTFTDRFTDIFVQKEARWVVVASQLTTVKNM